MIVAFDLDDTITLKPLFFSLITSAPRSAGHRVVITTFREDPIGTAEALGRCGISYDQIVNASSAELVDVGVLEWKGLVCARLGVEVFFEDDQGVIEHVPEDVLVFSPRLIE